MEDNNQPQEDESYFDEMEDSEQILMEANLLAEQLIDLQSQQTLDNFKKNMALVAKDMDRKALQEVLESARHDPTKID